VPIDVGRFTTEVTVADGDLPLSTAQIEKLIQLVVRRMEERQRDQERANSATAIRGNAVPSVRTG